MRFFWAGWNATAFLDTIWHSFIRASIHRKPEAENVDIIVSNDFADALSILMIFLEPFSDNTFKRVITF